MQKRCCALGVRLSNELRAYGVPLQSLYLFKDLLYCTPNEKSDILIENKSVIQEF